MTTEEFDILIEQCSNGIQDFCTRAKWFIKPSEEPDSVCITVKLLTSLDAMSPSRDNIRLYLMGESITQDSEECIRNAVACLNEELLTKII